VKRINEALIERGYITWFDLTNMKGELTFHRLPMLHFFLALELFDLYKHRACTGGDAGSTVDAMSDAIEWADVMLYGVSLAYKESANVSTFSNLI
jgi:hypothetical protein